jgi:hypothetical protein
MVNPGFRPDRLLPDSDNIALQFAAPPAQHDQCFFAFVLEVLL